MSDKTALGISEELRQFIEALVEEVVLEGKSFEEHKKYLARFCQTESVDYSLLETNLSDLFETAEELKTHESKASERFLRLLGKECYLSDDGIENIISVINNKRGELEEEDAKRRAEEVLRRKREAEERAKAERKAQEDAKKAREEAERERKAREAAERKAEAERKAKEEAERWARVERERKAQEEAERKAKAEARKAREDWERQAREAAERKAEAERKAREEAEFHEQFKKQWEKMMPSWYKKGLK